MTTAIPPEELASAPEPRFTIYESPAGYSLHPSPGAVPRVITLKRNFVLDGKEPTGGVWVRFSHGEAGFSLEAALRIGLARVVRSS